MKKLLSVSAIVGVIATAAMMVGCGGDGGHDNGGGPSVAPASIDNKIVTVSENGQNRNLTFTTSGSSFTQYEGTSTNVAGTGTFTYSKQGDNTGQLVLTTADQNGATSTVTYNLTFNSADSGTYTFTTSNGETGSGTFSGLQDFTGGGGNTGGGGDNGGGGNTGGGGDNGGGGNTGGGTPPTTLSGAAIDFTAGGGNGNERLTFSGSGNSVTSDVVPAPNNVGTYTFTPGSGGAPSTLVITFPNGDNYNLTLSFTDSTHGTWSGTQHYDGGDHPVPSGSSFTIAP
jgi:hypothetical protein